MCSKETRGCASDAVSFAPPGGFFPRTTRLAQAPQAESIAAGVMHDEDDRCPHLQILCCPAKDSFRKMFYAFESSLQAPTLRASANASLRGRTGRDP